MSQNGDSPTEQRRVEPAVPKHYRRRVATEHTVDDASSSSQVASSQVASSQASHQITDESLSPRQRVALAYLERLLNFVLAALTIVERIWAPTSQLLLTSPALRFSFGVPVVVAMVWAFGSFPVVVATALVNAVYVAQQNTAERYALWARFRQMSGDDTARSSGDRAEQIEQDWLNGIVGRLWLSTLPGVFAGFLHETLEPLLSSSNAATPIRVGDFSLGALPPRLTELQLVHDDAPQRVLILEGRLQLASPELFVRLLLQAKSVPIVVTLDSIVVAASVRLTLDLGDDSAEQPRLLSVSLLEQPVVDFALKASGMELSAFPGIGSFLRRLLATKIRDLVVWPAAFTLPLSGTRSAADIEAAAAKAKPYIADIAVVYPRETRSVPYGYVPLLRSYGGALADLSFHGSNPDVDSDTASPPSSLSLSRGPCFLFYRRTASLADAITHIAFVSGHGVQLPERWHVVKRALSGRAADLTADRPLAKPSPVYLAFRRAGLSDPVCELSVTLGSERACNGAADPVKYGHRLVPHNLMPLKEDRHTFAFLTFKRKPPPSSAMPDLLPIVDVALVFLDQNEVPPDGFELVSVAHTVADGAASVTEANLSTRRSSSARTYVAYQRAGPGVAKPPIADITLFCPGDGRALLPAGYDSLVGTVGNKNASLVRDGAELLYIAYRRLQPSDPIDTPVLFDLGVLVLPRSDIFSASVAADCVPSGFDVVDVDINRRSSGSHVYLMKSRSLLSPTMRFTCGLAADSTSPAPAASSSSSSSLSSSSSRVPSSQSVVASRSTGTPQPAPKSDKRTLIFGKRNKHRAQEKEVQDRLIELGCSAENQEKVRLMCENPESWLNFPLDDMPPDGRFWLNDFQKNHVSQMLKRVPQLARLRLSLVPKRLTEDQFWHVYFSWMKATLQKNVALEDEEWDLIFD